MYSKTLFILLPVLIGLTFLGGASSQSAEINKLTMGVVPEQSPSQLAKQWVPLLDELGKKLDLEIIFKTAKDTATFEICLSEGAYDLAFMNPFQYVEANWHNGYTAFAYQRGENLAGILVTRKDSAIQGISALKNLQIAFPSSRDFAATILPRADLEESGTKVRPIYVRAHESVYRVVARGLFLAGGGSLQTFKHIPKDVRNQLRIFHKTKQYIPHAFAAHPRVELDLVKRISEQLVKLPPTHPILRNLGFNGFESATNHAWDDVRLLNLPPAAIEFPDADSKCYLN